MIDDDIDLVNTCRMQLSSMIMKYIRMYVCTYVPAVHKYGYTVYHVYNYNLYRTYVCTVRTYIQREYTYICTYVCTRVYGNIRTYVHTYVPTVYYVHALYEMSGYVCTLCTVWIYRVYLLMYR